MAGLLSLPYEVQLMVFMDIPNVHRLAVLCKGLLAVVQECTYDSITLSSCNIENFFDASEKTKHALLRYTRNLCFGSPQDILEYPSFCQELLQHARPITLHMFFWIEDETLGGMDFSRLREWATWIGPVHDLLQQASTTLVSLDILSCEDSPPFKSPHVFLPMLALTSMHLYLEGIDAPRLHDIPRFMQSCSMLTYLRLRTFTTAIAENILCKCGKSLTELDLYVSMETPHSTLVSSIDLATCTPELRKLTLQHVETPYFAPYPSTLEELELERAPLEVVVAVLAEVLSPTALPALKILRVDVYEAEADEDQVVALMAALRAACEARQLALTVS